MLQIARILLFGFLLQDGHAPAVDPAAVETQVAAFTAACNEKEYDKAEGQVAPLVAKFAELGVAMAAADLAKDPASRDLATACRKARKQVTDSMEKVVRAPRAPARLQQKILATFCVHSEEGEKLALTALGLAHVIDVPASQAAAVTALGSARKTKYVETFEKLLRDPHADVVNAAAHAMGEYFGEKEEVRKRIVGKVILAYSSVASRPVSGGGSASGRLPSDMTLEVRHEFQIALARLTGGVHFDRAILWADWYRDQKDAKWNDGVDRPSIKLDGLVPGPDPNEPKKH